MSDEERTIGRGAAAPGRGPVAVAAAALVVWLVVAVPLGAGWRTLFFRDVFSNHFLLKAFGAQCLERGEIPAFNPALGLGQPFRGNPSALAFYPGNVLYLVLPFWSAYNLHFALHWLLAMLTMWALARELGQRPAAALVAAITYGGSGWLLSCLSFYNILTVAAWWPLVLVGAHRGGRRGIALGGLACGLALLGGEPVTAALGLVPLLVVAVARHRAVRGLATAAAVGALGTVVALPQVVAALRVSDFTFRGGHGLIPSQAVSYALRPLRYLELLLPLPFGRPLDVGPSGFWAGGIAPNLPFFLTLYAGIVGLVLAAGAVRRRPGWAALAAAGLLLAWLAGTSGELVLAVTGGLFRFPEKFLVWYALALPLLAGWGLEAVLDRPRSWAWVAAAGAGGGLALLLAGLTQWLRPAIVGGSARLGTSALPVDQARLVDVQLGLAALAFAAAGALLVAAGWALSRRSATALAALQLAALLQLWPLVRTDETAPYRQPSPWMRRIPTDAAVFTSYHTFPQWHPPPRWQVGATTKAAYTRFGALDLAPAPGVLFGLSYPLFPDVEGLSSPLYTLLVVNLPRLGWPERVRWMRAVGLDAAVLLDDLELPGLTRLDRVDRAGVPTYLFAVEGTAPDAWWPERIEPVVNPVAAIERVASLDDPVTTVVVSRPVEHRPGGTVRLLAAEPDHLELEVSGSGGVVAVRRSYQHLWTARTGDRELPILPLNLTLMGVEVPPGDHRVRLEVSAWPEGLAGGIALVAAVCSLAMLGWRRDGRRGGAWPLRGSGVADPAATGRPA